MLLCILLTLFQALAHPVTFKDGLAVTSIHRPKMTMSQINYTIHRNVAVATSYVRMENPTGGLNMPALHANILMKRWRSHWFPSQSLWIDRSRRRYKLSSW